MNEEDVSKTEVEEAEKIVRGLEYNQPESQGRWVGSKTKELFAMIEGKSRADTNRDKFKSIRPYSDNNMDSSGQPRNIKNNNLGNIKHNPNNKWEGQTSKPQDKTFVSFETPEYGVRALKKVINANIKATNNIEEYVNRYASEPKEKAYYKKHGKLMPHLQNYANTIAESQGVSTKEFPKNIDMKSWIKATAIAEGGRDALAYFTDDIIDKGIRM